MFINVGKSLYTIIYVLFAIIIVMMVLSYFNINLNPNENANIKLNRSAIFEGYGKVDAAKDLTLTAVMQN